MPVVHSSERVVPESLRNEEIWVVWDMVDKIPLAPWNTGHMYPSGWKKDMLEDDDVDVDERPETTYEKARIVSQMGLREVHSAWPFPRDDDGNPELPDEVRPTFLLPPEPDELRLMQVDIDDTRDPEMGEITKETKDIVDRLDSYTEISRSGEGLHVFVYATLPGRLGEFVSDLNEKGGIEFYDHGRFVGVTLDHVDGAPETVEERQEEVEELIERYASEEDKERRDGTDMTFEERRAEAERVIEGEVTPRARSASGTSNYNPYYDLDVASIAETDSTYRRHARDGKGPHPAHGGTQHDDSASTNFQVDTSRNCWNCFVPRDGGGGPLELIAVMENVCECEDAQRGFLKNNPKKLLKTCLLARDKYAGGRLDDADPPYNALLGVAKELDLVLTSDGGLDKDARHIAFRVYESMTADDVTV